MAASGSVDAAPGSPPSPSTENDGRGGGGVLGTALSARHIEAFGRKVTSTAGQLIGPLSDPIASTHYQHAMSEIQRGLQRPSLQRGVFSIAHNSPREMVRSKLFTKEIQYRALSYVPDELLRNVPASPSPFSLFQGFQASLPDTERKTKESHKKKKLEIEDDEDSSNGHASITKLKKERKTLTRRLDMMGIRKHMCSSEIHEIDGKISNLQNMRKIVLDRLASLEHEEIELEHDLDDFDSKIDALQEEFEDAALSTTTGNDTTVDDSEASVQQPEFMSESIYQKIPSPRSKRKQKSRRKLSMPILHEHFEPGSNIKSFEAHSDVITAMDFDYPFGTLVTASLDDSVRVWDLNRGRCVGFLEGHIAPVRCLQVEDNIVATGSVDATIRLWDLSRAEFPADSNPHKTPSTSSSSLSDLGVESSPDPTTASALADCPLFTLSAHVDEITAIHFYKDTLVSGSADKTIRQWDLVKGRCVQTLDVLWAAAQASAAPVETTATPATINWRNIPGRHAHNPQADFVGALQVFDAALACGTADGMVRLWDLRSGQVHRSLVGHTGPITALQFDDVHLVTGSLDRSIRMWDLRTGSIHDAFAYANPITSMQFDARRIVAAAGEPVVKVYDLADGRHWDCCGGVIASNVEEDEGTLKAPKVDIVDKVRVKDGFLVEGRRSGGIGIWSC